MDKYCHDNGNCPVAVIATAGLGQDTSHLLLDATVTRKAMKEGSHHTSLLPAFIDLIRYYYKKISDQILQKL